MSHRRTSFLCRCATLSLLCRFAISSAQAQSTKQPDDNPTIQSLLNEVRLLRKTLQQTGLNAYRSQIILERMRAHNEQVVRLTRMLDDVRNDMEKVQSTIPRMIEQGKMIESMIDQETDMTKRARLEFDSKETKRMVDDYKLILERHRAREQQLSGQLRDEQAKLVELENRLDALEREIENEIERQRAEDAPQEVKKRP